LEAFQEGNSCLLSPGAPDSPVHHQTLSGADLFPYLAKTTVGALEPLAHRTLSGAHRTVRCPLPTVGSATCLAQIAPPTVGPADRWLTGQSGAHRTVRCTPDSPVNYSRTPPMKSREQRVRTSQPGAPDTVRCTTGHCPVHHRTVRCSQTEQNLGCSSQGISNCSFPVFSTYTQYISL
jgi:hypothetical protein